MSWLDKILPSRIRASKENKASVPEGLWHKCASCETVIYRAEFEKNLNVCPKCNHHGRISARKELMLSWTKMINMKFLHTSNLLICWASKTKKNTKTNFHQHKKRLARWMLLLFMRGKLINYQLLLVFLNIPFLVVQWDLLSVKNSLKQ